MDGNNLKKLKDRLYKKGEIFGERQERTGIYGERGKPPPSYWQPQEKRKMPKKMKKIFIILLIIFFVILICFGLGNTALAYNANFNNAASVVRTFKRVYGGIDYSAFFNQGFINACAAETPPPCQNLARSISSAAIAHAFLYRLDGDANDLNKTVYLLAKMTDLYSYWKSTSVGWSLNGLAGYNIGLASWFIWDNLSSDLKTAVKNVMVAEANLYLSRMPLPSQYGYDTRADDNVGVPGLLSATAYFFPEEPNAGQWLTKARCFAYHTTTIGRDDPYCEIRTIQALSNNSAFGLFRPSDTKFYLDFDGDGYWSWDNVNNKSLQVSVPVGPTLVPQDIERVYSFGADANSLPVSGDWNGDGLDEIGFFRPSDATFYLDYNGNGVFDSGTDPSFYFGSSSDLPISGDWNGDGKDEIGTFRIVNGITAYFYVDYNGSLAWEAGVDHSHSFGNTDDLPVIGKWKGGAQDYIGVYSPQDRSFYLDWDGDGAWNQTTDKQFSFIPTSDNHKFIPVAGDWNDDGRESIGLFDQDSAFFYLDWSENFIWDMPPTDMGVHFGRAADIPIIGKWLRKERFWMVNHAIRPNTTYMSMPADVFMDSYLVYKKAGVLFPTEYTRNLISLWNATKPYLNTTNFKWTYPDDWNSSGLFREISSLALLCHALNTECPLEAQVLEYKATNPDVNTFIEYSAPVQTQFDTSTFHTYHNIIVTKRYVLTALGEDDSFLRSLPLISSPPAPPTGLTVR